MNRRNSVLSLCLLLTFLSYSGSFKIESVVPNYGIYSGGARLIMEIELKDSKDLKDLEEHDVEIDEGDVSIHFLDSNDVKTECTRVEKELKGGNRLLLSLMAPPVANQSVETTGKIVAILTGKEGVDSGRDEVEFHFKLNPSVEKKFTPFMTLVSGGTRVTVQGKNLIGPSVIQMMASGVNGNEAQWSTRESCEAISSDELRCRTPKLLISENSSLSGAPSDRTHPLNLFSSDGDLRFHLTTDGMTHPLDLPNVYLDPTVKTFQDVQVYVVNRGNRRLYLEGVWPKIFPTLEDDMEIRVGGNECTDIKRENGSHVSCIPPPMLSHVIRYGLPHVTTLPVKVRIGNVERHLGMLRYEEDEEFTKSVPIIIMIVLLSIVLISSTIFGVLAHRSSRKYQHLLLSEDRKRSPVNEGGKKSATNNNNNNAIGDDNDDDDDDDDDRGVGGVGGVGGDGGDDDKMGGISSAAIDKRKVSNVKYEPFEVENLLTYEDEVHGGKRKK